MELSFRIINIIHETPDTKSFYLQHTGGANITYKAGQFLTFIFRDAGLEVRRSYSLGSAPGIDKHLFITVKRKPNGSISRRLFENYKTGDLLTAIEPAGKFVIDGPVAKQYVFIAAGSGITPVFSLIKYLLYFQQQAFVLLISQCRNEANIIYAAQLRQLQQQFGHRFKLVQLFSQPSSHQYLSQRLNNTLFETLIKRELAHNHVSNIQCYICGPVIFMLMAQFTLKLLHFNDEQIHKEQFVITPTPTAPLIADITPRNVTIFYRRAEHNISVTYPQSILDAALQHGIQLPYSCKAGICSTCIATCTRGQVIMSNNEVLTDKDIAAGKVLTCTGYAVTDLEIIIE
jgi:ring-1,2-phenylacetyl-CoA epoxidase subunit PaaE